MLWTFEDTSAKRSQGNLLKAPVQVRVMTQSRQGGFSARQQAAENVCCAGLTIPWGSPIGLVPSDPTVHSRLGLTRCWS